MAIPPFFSDHIALAQYVNFYEINSLNQLQSVYRGQNFYIDTVAKYSMRLLTEDYAFVPFGFTGITNTRNGDNESTSLILPNNSVVRTWANALLAPGRKRVVQVDTLIVDPADSTNYTTLSSYIGQVIGAGWQDTRVEIELGSVLDAVSSDVPRRVINESLCGPLPTSSNVRLS